MTLAPVWSSTKSPAKPPTKNCSMRSWALAASGAPHPDASGLVDFIRTSSTPSVVKTFFTFQAPTSVARSMM